MPGFDGQVMFCANMDFTDPTDIHFDHPGNFAAAGDLAIGTGVAPPGQEIAVGHLVGTGGIAIGFSAPNITIDGSGIPGTPLTVHTDGANAVEAAGAITIAGGASGIHTAGAGSTVTLSLSAIPNTSLSNSSITLSNGNNITVTGSPVALGGTATINVSGTTQHAIQIGNASNSLTSIAVGSTGQFLQANTTADPTWSTATLPSTATGTGKILVADGTNWVASTPTFPNASATTRKIIVSDGTNWTASTETWAVPGTSGNVLTSDGTNWTSAASSGGVSSSTANATVDEFDDFMYGRVTTGVSTGAVFGPWQLEEIAAGAPTYTNSFNSNAASGRPGVLTFDSGNATTSRQTLFKSSTGQTMNGTAGCIVLGGGIVTLQWFAKLTTLSGAGDTYVIRIGMTNQSANTTVNDGCWFEYTDTVNSGAWTINTSNSSTAQTQNTNSTVDTNWHIYKIVVNAAATSVAFYIDGTQVNVSPNTLHIPTNPICPMVMNAKTAGTTRRQISVDLYTLNIPLTTPR